MAALGGVEVAVACVRVAEAGVDAAEVGGLAEVRGGGEGFEKQIFRLLEARDRLGRIVDLVAEATVVEEELGEGFFFDYCAARY